MKSWKSQIYWFMHLFVKLLESNDSNKPTSANGIIYHVNNHLESK